jgi:uncharacterized protein YjbI with pentapeptide repeats
MNNIENLTLHELMKLIEQGDNAKITEILVQFKDKWNSLMEENRKLNRQIHLNGLSLAKQDLSKLDLSDIIIEDSDLSGSDLTESDLSNARILRTTLNGTDLSFSRLTSSRISQSDLSRAKLYKVKTEKLYLTGSVNLFDAYFKERSEEEIYRTHPEITKRGFRMAEACEHDDREYQY